MVNALAVIGGAVVVAALAGSGWYVWRWVKGVSELS